MKAIAYNVLTHPSVFKTLRAELDAAHLSFPPSYEQTKELPYLNTVIKEVSAACSVVSLSNIHILRTLTNEERARVCKCTPSSAEFLSVSFLIAA